MNTPANSKPNLTKKRVPPLAAVAVGVVAVVCLVWGGIALYGALSGKSTANHAEDAAKPLEAALVAKGAMKICSQGDAGRGPDNDEPWYTAYFESAKDKPQAETLINTVASDNGYRLVQGSPGTKGFLGDIAYIDNTSKASPYPGFDNGKIALALVLSNSGPLRSCPTAGEISNDADHTAISLEVRLPAANR